MLIKICSGFRNTNEITLLDAAKPPDKTRLDRIQKIRTAKTNLEATYTADPNVNLEEMKVCFFCGSYFYRFILDHCLVVSLGYHAEQT